MKREIIQNIKKYLESVKFSQYDPQSYKNIAHHVEKILINSRIDFDSVEVEYSMTWETKAENVAIIIKTRFENYKISVEI